MRLLVQARDIECQIELEKPSRKASNASEFGVPLRTKVSSLCIWFLLNLSLALQSKMILGEVGLPSLTVSTSMLATSTSLHFHSSLLPTLEPWVWAVVLSSWQDTSIRLG
jgi:hypothetical protein